MTTYRVRWEVDQEADSPIEAAKQVWRRNFGRSYPPAKDSGCVFRVEKASPTCDKCGSPEQWDAAVHPVDLEQVAQDEGLALATDDRHPAQGLVLTERERSHMEHLVGTVSPVSYHDPLSLAEIDTLQDKLNSAEDARWLSARSSSTRKR